MATETFTVFFCIIFYISCTQDILHHITSNYTIDSTVNYKVCGTFQLNTAKIP